MLSIEGIPNVPNFKGLNTSWLLINVVFYLTEIFSTYKYIGINLHEIL